MRFSRGMIVSSLSACEIFRKIFVMACEVSQLACWMVSDMDCMRAAKPN